VHVPHWKVVVLPPLAIVYPRQYPLQVRDFEKIPNQDWVQAVIKEGSKGPMACEFAFLRVIESRGNLPATELWLIIRRNVDDPSILKYYFSNAPAKTPLSEFVRISGMRWPIETIFEEAKGEVGLDHYETRSWLGWHHPCYWFLWHITSWFGCGFAIKIKRLLSRCINFDCCLPVSCQRRSLMFKQLWTACAITRNAISSLISLIVSQNSLIWQFLRLTLRCNIR
jgi:hypothetical protein